MKTTFLKRISLIPFVIFIFCAFTWSPIFACTISVLTDSSNALFLNNEDYNNPKTRIWFVSGGKDYYAIAAYVGFDNGWGQGGLNEKGLAYDWVAGAKKEYNPAKGLKKVKGNTSERMLESCATVDEAIEFYKKYEEMSFTYAQIMIADKSGDSVLIGSKNGKIYFDKKTNSRGYGFCGLKLKIKMFLNSKATISNGEKILEECMQGGAYATKYSNVFDLKNGDIYLYRFKVWDKGIRLNLLDELKKGEHYYDIPEIQKQIKMNPKPLKVSMTRFPLDNFKTAKRVPENKKFDGTWKGIVPGPDGNPLVITYIFESEGENLEGYVSTELGEGPFSKGKIEGNRISFSVERADDIVYVDGTLSGDGINMTQKKGDKVNEFTLKRVRENEDTL